MQKSLESKLTVYINVAVLVSLLASVLLIYYFVGTLNRNSIESDRELVSGGFNALVEQNEVTTRDYGWWSPAQNHFEAGDELWLYNNMGSSIETPGIFDLLILSQEAEGKIYGWDATQTIDSRSDILTSAQYAALRLHLYNNYQAGLYSASHFLFHEGRPFVFTVTLVGAEENRLVYDPMTDPVLIVGMAIDVDALRSIENMFHVRDLSFIAGRVETANSYQLIDASGHLLGSLVWSPSVPGSQSLRLTLIPLLVYILIFLFAAHFLGKRAYALASRTAESERKARAAAKTDRLTGLDNRHGFNEYIESKIVQYFGAKGEVTFIFVDLNGFKKINDQAGHIVGDKVLKIVAERFMQTVNKDLFLARVGGDEFCCVLTGMDSHRNSKTVAQRMIDCLKEPLVIGDGLYQVGAAVGVAKSRKEKPLSFLELIHNADVAMYRAKQDQMTEPLFYDASLESEQKENREMAEEMEVGLERGEFHLHYQPIICSKGGSLSSVEALLRWDSPTRGSVGPAQFIPVAEETRLIQRLGDFVLRTVCHEIGPDADFSVAINLSPAQLKDPELCANFVSILAEYEMVPSDVELELTEGLLVDNLERAKMRLHEFVSAGFQINLDDFGTGFASLGYLKEFPFGKIKIDGSYGSNCGHDLNANQTLQALGLLSQSMNFKAVAEGVETEEQSKLIKMFGFEYMQGWFYGKPMPVEDFWLRYDRENKILSLPEVEKSSGS